MIKVKPLGNSAGCYGAVVTNHTAVREALALKEWWLLLKPAIHFYIQENVQEASSRGHCQRILTPK